MEIRVIAPAEVEFSIASAAREGWNPGVDDATCFLAADPTGFLAAVEGDDIVGCVSAVRYDGNAGFLGLYIVDPSRRGQGVGSRLWAAALDRLSGRTIGLDGVVAMQDAYRRSGFELAHRNIRYAGIAEPVPTDGVAGELGTVTRADVLAYDTACFGARRATFLDAWLDQPTTPTSRPPCSRLWWRPCHAAAWWSSTCPRRTTRPDCSPRVPV